VGNHFIQRKIGCKSPVLKAINTIVFVSAAVFVRPELFGGFHWHTAILTNFCFHVLCIYKITCDKSKQFLSPVKTFLTIGRLPVTVGNPTVNKSENELANV
jgi:hypothetical protein